MDIKRRRAFLGGIIARKEARLVTNNSELALDTLLMINILRALLVPGNENGPTTVQPPLLIILSDEFFLCALKCL